MAATTTLAEAWEAHAEGFLPAHATRDQRADAKRRFYSGALEAIDLQNRGTKPEALLAEILAFGRTVGREVV